MLSAHSTAPWHLFDVASRTAFEACDDRSDPENCQVRRSMTEVRDAIADILDNMTLEQFVASGNKLDDADEEVAISLAN